MEFIKRLFRKKSTKCWICDRNIYNGELYGYEREQSDLALTGYWEKSFCSNCIRNHNERCDERSIGNTFIIRRRNGDAHRVTLYRA